MSTKEKMVMGGLAQLRGRGGSSDEPVCVTETEIPMGTAKIPMCTTNNPMFTVHQMSQSREQTLVKMRQPHQVRAQLP